MGLQKIDKMGTLYRNRDKFFITLIIMWSCQNISEKKERSVSETDYMRVSKSIAKTEYLEVYKQAKDSLTFFANNGLKFYKTCKDNECLVDSLICFNRNNNKMITAILHKNTFFKDQTADGVEFYYGVKIKSKWYFFSGPYIPLPRSGYGYSNSEPMPFSKLHEIAMNEIFSGYLKKDSSGEFVIEDSFFSDLTSGAWYIDGVVPKNEEDWNKMYLKIVKNKW